MEKTVLLVDDEPKSLKLLRDILQRVGYKILEAEDGKRGIAIARAEKPDIILMDIQMPVMGGEEAIRILKADDETKNIPVIAVTAFAMRGDEEKIRRTGSDDYIPKPVKVAKILEVVARYLR